MQVKLAVNTSKSSAVFRIFAVLLFATFLSCHVVSGTVAKYVSGDSGRDSARVARFSVSANGDTSNGLNLAYGGSAEYTLTVNNTSEVDVSYRVMITFREDVGEKLNVVLRKTVGESTVDNSGTYDSTNRTFTFTGSDYQLNVGGSASYTIVISAKPGFLTAESNPVESLQSNFGFDTKVLFEQID